MTKKTRFFTLHANDAIHIFEIKRSFDCAPADTGQVCSCCEKPLQPVADFIQYGIFDDSYLTIMVCLECHWAYEFAYKIANYDLVPKREQKRMGVLLSKNIPAEPGKAGSK